MPGMMDFPLHGALRQALVEPEGPGYGQGLGRLYEALVNDLLYPQPSALWLFEGNHDTNRIFSALGEDPALMRLALVYMATIHRTTAQCAPTSPAAGPATRSTPSPAKAWAPPSATCSPS
jgi:hypothetical protein